MTPDRSARWTRCLAAALLCLSRVSSAPDTSSIALRDVLTEVVSEAVLKHCVSEADVPAVQADPAWRCGCPSGFIPCAGRCYARLHRAVEYGQAEKDCATLSAHLAVPRSREQNLCVAGLAGYRGVWLGVTDRAQEGVFQGADGRPLTGNEGQVWAGGQPDNHGGREHCVEIRAESGGFRFAEWNDWVCSGVVNFPMCQLPAV